MNIDEKKKAILKPAICPQCGGQVEVDAQREKVFCQYCGTQFIVEKAIHTYNVQHATIEHVDSITINKQSAVGSVLSFWNEQLKQAEEQRKEQEKFLKKNWWWMILLMFFVPSVIFAIIAIDEKVNNKIPINYSSSQLKGINYNDAITRLQNSGFTNIRTEAKKDIILGWLIKDGEVDHVEINGDYDFESDAKFPKDADIIVIYHTFRE